MRHQGDGGESVLRYSWLSCLVNFVLFRTAHNPRLEELEVVFTAVIRPIMPETFVLTTMLTLVPAVQKKIGHK